MDANHTILLVQPDADKYSRTYYDFLTMKQALTGICRLFENNVRGLNPTTMEITYDVADLFRWIDRLPDISMLVLDGKVYVPRGKVYIKNEIFKHIQTGKQNDF